jgi:hypothetical protein
LFEPTADNGSCKCFDAVAPDTTQQSATAVKFEVTGLPVGIWFCVRLSQKVGGVEKLSIANQIQRCKTTQMFVFVRVIASDELELLSLS